MRDFVTLLVLLIRKTQNPSRPQFSQQNKGWVVCNCDNLWEILTCSSKSQTKICSNCIGGIKQPALTVQWFTYWNLKCIIQESSKRKGNTVSFQSNTLAAFQWQFFTKKQLLKNKKWSISDSDSFGVLGTTATSWCVQCKTTCLLHLDDKLIPTTFHKNKPATLTYTHTRAHACSEKNPQKVKFNQAGA